jgi:hypothetical protein
MDGPNKVNKSLLIAKEINSEVQTLVNKMFEKSEATAALKASDPDMYFMHSDRIFAAIMACAAQRMLSDGLQRRRLYSRTNAGTTLAWDLFLDTNPEIAVKVAEAKAASAAKYAAKAASTSDENEEDNESDDE